MALEAKAAVNTHLSEEVLERYAFGRLPAEELGPFEEHLLVCVHCQQQLENEDNFAEAMAALARLEQDDRRAFNVSNASSAEFGSPVKNWAALASFRLKRISQSGNFRSPIPAFRSAISEITPRKKSDVSPWWSAGLAAVAAIGLGIAAWSLPLRLPAIPFSNPATQTVQAVTLRTYRGGDAGGMAEATAKRPLELAIDMRETAISPGESGSYQVEVVDAAGRQAWRGTGLSAASGMVRARVEKRLAAGVYWVRLFAPSGRLLREFGLHLS